jgi:hypothetical protein
MTRLNHNKPPAQPLLMLCALFLGMIMFAGCDKFEGNQDVPAYLQIDSLGFSSDYDVQGTEKQEIVDAWIYVDDNLVGGFEMPALIPVLAEGIHKLEIRPGIILNGISDTRAPYPCIEPMIFESVRFTADSITVKYASTSYYDNAEFVWMEDFEDASLAIKASANSDTGIYRTSPAGAGGAFIDANSMYSGISYLDTTSSYLQLVSEEGNGAGFAFDRGDFIFLELHYKNDTPVAVGVYIKLMDGTVQERPFLILSPSAGWNKIYVNFTPIVNETVDAVNYTFYFEAQLPDDTENAFVMLDNIKLVTRPNL